MQHVFEVSFHMTSSTDKVMRSEGSGLVFTSWVFVCTSFEGDNNLIGTFVYWGDNCGAQI